MEDQDNEPSWVAPTHAALVDGGVTIVGVVPDGGLQHLIRRLEPDSHFTVVRLTTEEEGVALAAGAWLGGKRAAVLMQSSGVGNCTNMLSLLKTCEIPAVLLITMRGQAGESNPWQTPMSEATGPTLKLMGVNVTSIGSPDDVAGAVSQGCARAFERGEPAQAILIEQQVVGVKLFVGDAK
jgi:sulfopyruvate decarboxylase alpha subunit